MQTYQIADLSVNMDTWGRTLQQAQIYAISPSQTPDISIPSEAEQTKQVFPHLSLDECEYMATGRQFYSRLLQFDGLMIHSSAVVMDGKAYLFSAPSGTGKSTHTRLWQRVFGEDRAQILNDDKPAVRLVDGCWYAYGTPWSGKSTTSLNLRVPIAGICFLKRGPENSIRKLPPAQAAFRILDQTVRTKDFRLRELLLAAVDKLVSNVNVYEMQCNMEPEAAMLSHRVIFDEYNAKVNGE